MENNKLNEIKATLLYINFDIENNSQKNVLCENDSFNQNKQYEDLLAKIRIFNPYFCTLWEQVDKIIFNKWLKLAKNGSLYIKSSQEYSHYIKVLLDQILGKEKFLNEIIWVKNPVDKNSKHKLEKKSWQKAHETILVYVKDKNNYIYNVDQIDREPYMAPSLVTAEKVSKGKLPTDTWWYSILDCEEKVLNRIVKASSFENDYIQTLFGNYSTVIKDLHRNEIS